MSFSDFEMHNNSLPAQPAEKRVSRRMGILGVAFVAGLFLMLGAPEHAHTTDCTAVAGVTPDGAPKVDCPSPPCKPNACSCPAGTCSAGCGPLTTCVMLGSDPPITDTLWQETLQGYPAPSGFFSGKCAPPNDSGVIVCPTKGGSGSGSGSGSSSGP